jgi:hypothetical protein
MGHHRISLNVYVNAIIRKFDSSTHPEDVFQTCQPQKPSNPMKPMAINTGVVVTFNPLY